MNNLIDYIQNDLVVVGRSMKQLFWGIVEEAQRTRLRLRAHHELSRLHDRENFQYQRLGHLGFSLFRDQVPVVPGPETAQILAEVGRLRAEQQRRKNLPDLTPQSEVPPFPWRRLESLIESGDWVVDVRILPETSPWCGRPMSDRHPPGVCLAVQRGESVQPWTAHTTALPGDALIIAAPASSASAWDGWIAWGTDEVAGSPVTGPEGAGG